MSVPDGDEKGRYTAGRAKATRKPRDADTIGWRERSGRKNWDAPSRRGSVSWHGHLGHRKRGRLANTRQPVECGDLSRRFRGQGARFAKAGASEALGVFSTFREGQDRARIQGGDPDVHRDTPQAPHSRGSCRENDSRPDQEPGGFARVRFVAWPSWPCVAWASRPCVQPPEGQAACDVVAALRSAAHGARGSSRMRIRARARCPWSRPCCGSVSWHGHLGHASHGRLAHACNHPKAKPLATWLLRFAPRPTAPEDQVGCV
jgi:hypothetical protein